MNIIIDLVLLGIIALCAWTGYRKGFILGITGIVALVIAFFGANLVAETYASEFNTMLEPFISGIVDESVDEAQAEQNISATDAVSQEEVYSVSYESLRKIGIIKTAASNLAEELSESVSSVGQTLKSALVDQLCQTAGYVLLLFISFVLIVIIFTVIGNVINLAFKLPGLELINDILGTAFGLVKGLVFAFAIAWLLRFTGLLISEETVEKTIVLEWLMEHNPITNIFGL